MSRRIQFPVIQSLDKCRNQFTQLVKVSGTADVQSTTSKILRWLGESG
jgi:hypothetical protein